MKKQLQIISSTHAREVNPIKDKPISISLNYFERERYVKWAEKELSLKEYRIEEIDNLDLCPIKIGSIHSAETNEELNTAIIL